jgi:hypothetical protein
MSVISSMAAPTRSPAVFRTLLREARRHGQPSAIDYLTFLQIWLIPPQLRRGLRDLVLGRRRANPAAGQPETAGTTGEQASVDGRLRFAHVQPARRVSVEPGRGGEPGA